MDPRDEVHAHQRKGDYHPSDLLFDMMAEDVIDTFFNLSEDMDPPTSGDPDLMECENTESITHFTTIKAIDRKQARQLATETLRTLCDGVDGRIFIVDRDIAYQLSSSPDSPQTPTSWVIGFTCERVVCPEPAPGLNDIEGGLSNVESPE